MRKQILPRTVHPRAFLAIPADGGVHDTRIDLLHSLVIKTEPTDNAGSEILDQHIGLTDQLPQRSQIFLVLQIDGEAFFAAIDRVKQGRVAAYFRIAQIEPARKITAVWPLDLDNARTQIKHAQRAIWAGQELAHVQHHNAVQRKIVM